LSEEWAKSGNEVYMITSNSSHLNSTLPTFKGKFFYEDINGVNTYWLNTFKNKNSSGASRILSWLHFEYQLLTFNKKKLAKPDVIIASSLSLLSIVSAWYLSKKYKSKLVFEVRDIWPLSIIVLGGYSRYNPFIKALSAIEKFGYEKSGLIVGTMPNLQKHVHEVTDKGAKCITIPQGVSLDFYTSGQRPLDEEYKAKWLQGNKFRICYAGTVNVNNPLDAFIEAARLLKDHEHIQFVILGNGDKKDDLIKLSSDLPNVIFPPTVAKEQVYDFLSNMDICYDSFDPKLASYGLSRNKWIDYMFAAKPIICAYDGFKSMINEADCGEFIPFDDAETLSRVILDYSRLTKHQVNEIGERGKNFLIHNRTFTKLAADYLVAINEINV